MEPLFRGPNVLLGQIGGNYAQIIIIIIFMVKFSLNVRQHSYLCAWYSFAPKLITYFPSTLIVAVRGQIIATKLNGSFQSIRVPAYKIFADDLDKDKLVNTFRLITGR